MAKDNKEKSEPSKVEAAPISGSALVEVEALKNVNTSEHGSIREGQKGKLGIALAKQLEELGEVKILK